MEVRNGSRINRLNGDHVRFNIYFNIKFILKKKKRVIKITKENYKKTFRLSLYRKNKKKEFTITI